MTSILQWHLQTSATNYLAEPVRISEATSFHPQMPKSFVKPTMGLRGRGRHAQTIPFDSPHEHENSSRQQARMRVESSNLNRAPMMSFVLPVNFGFGASRKVG